MRPGWRIGPKEGTVPMHLLRRVGACALSSGWLQAVGLMFCVLALLSWAPRAGAHASLVSSTPPAGAVLPQTPAVVRLTFNEPVSPLVMKIVRPDGSVQDVARVHAQATDVEVPLPRLEQRGTYGLSWRVVSADGHPVGGTLPFSVGDKGAGQAPAAEADWGRNVLIWLARLGGYAGLFFGVGLAACHAWAARSGDRRRLALGLLALGGGATVLNVGLLGVDALDRPVTGLFSPDAWRMAGSTSFGHSAALALIALVCAVAVWRVAAPVARRALAVVAVMLLGASLAASGHASSAPPVWLARPAVWLHGVAVAVWIGSLIPLARSLESGAEQNLLRRFSRLIPVVLLVLFISGGTLVYLQFDALSSLWLTAYGRVLALKLALVAVLVGLGAYNRYRLTGAVLRAESSARHAMRRMIRVECVVALAILEVVAFWRFTPPPRALASMAEAPATFYAHVHTDAAMAELFFTPPAGGRPGTLRLQLSGADRVPLAAQEVDVAFANAQAGVEPIAFPASRTGEGAWQVNGIALPSVPSWDVRIDALVSDFERVSLETTLKLGK